MEALGLNWMGRKVMGGAAMVDNAFQYMFASAGFYGKLHAAKVRARVCVWFMIISIPLCLCV